MMLPWTVIYAAGLGKLTLNSALGQPLNAEIDIVTTSSDEVASLKASVATREAFAQAGINYESIFSSLRISVESRSNGNPYIKLTSPQAVNDPFLNILMELNWVSGRILREYTVLLDPVDVNNQDIARPDVSSTPIINVTRQDTERLSDAKKDRQSKNSSKSINRSVNQVKDTYGPVNRGDTLSSIARQFLPAGVDLNQMLVALYRTNRDAFIASNMNLLKAGVILKIPEKNEIAAIDASTAKAEIRMQVGDWHSYQGKIAAISSESTAHSNIRQSDQGQITTSIDKKATSSQGSSKEVLRVSSGSQPADKNGQTSESTLVDRLRMMEEDAIARNLALQEANQRVAMLEKSIENLKQLLELKDSVLAQAQVKAESAPKTGPETRSTEISLPEKDPNLDINALRAQEQKNLIAHPVNEIATKAVEANSRSLEDEGQSFTDQIFDNIEYVGAGLILILLSILLILKRRRNQLQEETENDEIRSADFSSEIRSRMASMATAPVASAAEANQSFSSNENDDVTYENLNSFSETEKYDEELDKDLISYQESTEQIEKSESENADDSGMDDLRKNNQAIDLNLTEDHDESVRFIEGEDASDSASGIDLDLTDEVVEIKQNVSMQEALSADNDTKESIGSSNTAENLEEAINASDYELAIDFDDSKQSSDSISSEEMVVKKDESNAIDFEFDHSDIDLTRDEAVDEIKIPEMKGDSELTNNDSKIPELVDESLEFDQHSEATQDRMKSVSNDIELGLADINLDLDDSNSIDQKDEKSGLKDRNEQWQEVETKLDLAKAYQEMDDKEGAKEMLEEVIRDGDAKQKKAARKLLKSL